MTPEEAIPRRAVINGITPMDSQYTEFFTAKETAEIAKAYGIALSQSYVNVKAAETRERFENLFQEWSK